MRYRLRLGNKRACCTRFAREVIYIIDLLICRLGLTGCVEYLSAPSERSQPRVKAAPPW